MTAVLDTLEVRWFAPGEIPPEVLDWFADGGRVHPTDERCDTYRADGLVDTGVKLRSKRTLEVKSRRGFLEPITLSSGLVAAPELWRRWSPAEDPGELTEDVEWIDVSKRIFKRRFTPAGVEAALSPEFPPSGGCDAEIVAIGVGDVTAWSFALAAFGRAETTRDSLVASWRALVADGAPPAGFETALGTCAGYAAWLATLGTRCRA